MGTEKQQDYMSYGQIEKARLMKEKNVKENSLKNITIIVIFCVLFYTLIQYFDLKMWQLFAILLSLVISLITAIITGELIATLKKKQQVIYFILAMAIAGIVSYGIHSHTTHLKMEMAKNEVQKETYRKAQIAEEKKQQERETSDFLASNEAFKIYGVAGNDSWALVKAKQAIEKWAHDPSSVSDIEARSSAVRMRIKKYPNCRYGLSVQFRAKNRLGALVLNSAAVLYDSDWNVIQVLEKPFF